MADTQQLSNYFPQSTLSCPVWVKHASLDQSPEPRWLESDGLGCYRYLLEHRGTYLKAQVELLKIIRDRKEKVLGKHKYNWSLVRRCPAFYPCIEKHLLHLGSIWIYAPKSLGGFRQHSGFNMPHFHMIRHYWVLRSISHLPLSLLLSLLFL